MDTLGRLGKLELQKILFLDIETVPQYSYYANVPANLKSLWQKKATMLSKESEASELYKRAGIYAEFGKIICISFGYIASADQQKQIRIKSIYGDDEHKLLTEFASILKQHFSTPSHRLCAHNGKEFDFPYLCRRFLINGLTVPKKLDTRGMKPWETPFLDTLELWRFGDYKHYTSLELLTAIFDIPTPKDDIDGSMVGDVYWKENDLERIVSYCQKDVVSVIQLFLKYVNESFISEIVYS